MANADTVKVFKFDVVQIRTNGEWLDYATVKDASDVEGLARLAYARGTYRIKRYTDGSGHAITTDQVYEFAGKSCEWH